MTEKILQIKYYIWGGLEGSYYELEIDDISFIRYLHDGVIVKERSLNQTEIDQVLRVVEITTIIPRLNIDDGYQIIPCVFSNIEIKSKNGVIDYWWNNAESDNNKKELKSLVKLIDTVMSLLEIDFSKLNLPRYL